MNHKRLVNGNKFIFLVPKKTNQKTHAGNFCVSHRRVNNSIGEKITNPRIAGAYI